MHATWLAAATLLNLNAFVATSRGVQSGLSIATAHFSPYAVLTVNLILGYLSKDPLIPLTAIWALSAVVSRTSEKGSDAVTQSLVVTEKSVIAVLIGAAALIVLKNCFDFLL